MQFLGFLEVVRREGPRERSFLAAGNPQGSDTLATLVESFRFVLCASPATLQVRNYESDSLYNNRLCDTRQTNDFRHVFQRIPAMMLLLFVCM